MKRKVKETATVGATVLRYSLLAATLTPGKSESTGLVMTLFMFLPSQQSQV